MAVANLFFLMETVSVMPPIMIVAAFSPFGAAIVTELVVDESGKVRGSSVLAELNRVSN
jgi:hypothetical protein